MGEYFPDLCTESDKPQCPECFECDEQIRAAHQTKDHVVVQMISEKKKQHRNNARELFELQKKIQARSITFSEEGSLVVDNMASKSIPKHRRDKSDAWSKDKLTLILGVLIMTIIQQLIILFILIFNQSANTIISQLADSLKRLKLSKPSIQRVTISFDNHATQKNYTVVGYLEWQYLNGYLPENGISSCYSWNVDILTITLTQLIKHPGNSTTKQNLLKPHLI